MERGLDTGVDPSFSFGGANIESKMFSISAIGISTLERPAPGSARLTSWLNHAMITECQLKEIYIITVPVRERLPTIIGET